MNVFFSSLSRFVRQSLGHSRNDDVYHHCVSVWLAPCRNGSSTISQSIPSSSQHDRTPRLWSSFVIESFLLRFLRFRFLAFHIFSNVQHPSLSKRFLLYTILGRRDCHLFVLFLFRPQFRSLPERINFFVCFCFFDSFRFLLEKILTVCIFFLLLLLLCPLSNIYGTFCVCDEGERERGREKSWCFGILFLSRYVCVCVCVSNTTSRCRRHFFTATHFVKIETLTTQKLYARHHTMEPFIETTVEEQQQVGLVGLHVFPPNGCRCLHEFSVPNWKINKMKFMLFDGQKNLTCKWYFFSHLFSIF